MITHIIPGLYLTFTCIITCHGTVVKVFRDCIRGLVIHLDAERKKRSMLLCSAPHCKCRPVASIGAGGGGGGGGGWQFP